MKIAANKRSGANKNLLVAAAAILIVVGYFGFKWMRGLMRLGYEDSVIRRMRLLYLAETQFAKEHPTLGYTCALAQLPAGEELQRLVANHGIENGYALEIAGCKTPDSERPNPTYSINARPLHSGQPAFCSDQSGVIRADYGGSVERCRVNGVAL